MAKVFQSNIFQHNVFQVGSTTSGGARSLLAFWMGGAGAAPFAVKGVRSLLAFWMGGASSPRSHRLGWMPEWGTGRFRHDPEELERRLARQRGLSREQYAQLLEDITTKAKEAKNKAQRKALKAALESAKLVEIESPAIDPAPLLLALEEVATAKRIKESTEAARHAEAIARAYYEYEFEQDEEEALVLLLN
jgi:hypothetical protein